MNVKKQEILLKLCALMMQDIALDKDHDLSPDETEHMKAEFASFMYFLLNHSTDKVSTHISVLISMLSQTAVELAPNSKNATGDWEQDAVYILDNVHEEGKTVIKRILAEQGKDAHDQHRHNVEQKHREAQNQEDLH